MRYRNEVRGNIGSPTIMEAYQRAFGMSWWQFLLANFQGVFKFADQYYRELDERMLFDILEHDKTDLEKYVAEDFDCDNFTFRLFGVYHTDLRTAAMPIFITWVSWTKNGKRYGHAVLSYYYKGEVRIIEPQNDMVYTVPEDWSLNLMCG